MIDASLMPKVISLPEGPHPDHCGYQLLGGGDPTPEGFDAERRQELLPVLTAVDDLSRISNLSHGHGIQLSAKWPERHIGAAPYSKGM